MRIVDLSATLKSTPEGVPPLLGSTVTRSDHAEGARTIEQMLGVPPQLLRRGEGWAVEEIALGTHNTTHVDAPWHYNSVIRGEPAQTIDKLPLEWFFGPGVVLDMTAKADGDPMTAAEAEAELARIGHTLAPGHIVLVRTGRDRFIEQPDYMALGCGVTAEATHWLYDRGVRVMGIDAWGWDAPLHLQAEEAKRRELPGIFWAAHQSDLAYSQIERLVNLGALPANGFTVACFPLKVEGGSAGPARVVAIFDN
jgi:kynurenine formamidase